MKPDRPSSPRVDGTADAAPHRRRSSPSREVLGKASRRHGVDDCTKGDQRCAIRPGRPRRRQDDRAAGFGRHVENTYGLERWKLRMVAHGVATTIAIAASLRSTSGRQGDRVELVEKAPESCARRQTRPPTSARHWAPHAVSERLDRGDDFTPVEPMPPMFAAYRETLDAHGLAVADGMIECHASTTSCRPGRDLRPRTVDGSGQHFIGDLKTGQSVDLAQVGIAGRWRSTPTATSTTCAAVAARRCLA